jgi:hypothetical protein
VIVPYNFFNVSVITIIICSNVTVVTMVCGRRTFRRYIVTLSKSLLSIVPSLYSMKTRGNKSTIATSTMIFVVVVVVIPALTILGSATTLPNRCSTMPVMTPSGNSTTLDRSKIYAVVVAVIAGVMVTNIDGAMYIFCTTDRSTLLFRFVTIVALHTLFTIPTMIPILHVEVHV